MELLSLAREALQTAAERAASYRLGQSALRCMDRALWVVEKSARWAVPPPLDQDERPQPELVRPLPWLPFLALLLALRVTREAISLLNLALGRPPLRSADVVTYIQGKRRYLRTLKYQGTRLLRARSEAGARGSWYSRLQTLFDFTMCFRRRHYGNNNTQLHNGDEVFVVKRNKRTRQEANTVAAPSETSMERLIEKMMVDVDVDSDESSGYTLTNITSGRSDRSDYNTESDQETIANPQVDSQNNETLERHNVTPELNTISTGDENIKGESADSCKSKDNSIESIQSKDRSINSNQLNDDSIDSNQSKETVAPSKSKEKSIDSCQSKYTSFESNESKDTSMDSRLLTEKSLDSYQSKVNSNDSMTRLENNYDTEENSDTKEATMNFIQSEIGARISGNGNSQCKIGRLSTGTPSPRTSRQRSYTVNGGISRDLTATER